MKPISREIEIISREFWTLLQPKMYLFSPLLNNDARKPFFPPDFFLSPQGEMCITGGEAKRNLRMFANTFRRKVAM
jgi:hypothetical protein